MFCNLRALEADPTYVKALYRRIVLLVELEQFSEAMQLCIRCMSETRERKAFEGALRMIEEKKREIESRGVSEEEVKKAFEKAMEV